VPIFYSEEMLHKCICLHFQLAWHKTRKGIPISCTSSAVVKINCGKEHGQKLISIYISYVQKKLVLHKITAIVGNLAEIPDTLCIITHYCDSQDFANYERFVKLNKF
jgi:hypothetical protein